MRLGAYICICASLFLIFSCDDGANPLIQGKNPGNVPESEVLSLEGILRNESGDTTWYMADDDKTQIIEIDIDEEFPFAKEVYFSTYIRTSLGVNRVFAELYNITDNRKIQHRELSSTRSYADYVVTENLLEVFPKGKIKIGVRIKSQKLGFGVSSRTATILIRNRIP